jgi:hypothetical protein
LESPLHIEYDLLAEGLIFLLIWACEVADLFTKATFPKSVVQQILIGVGIIALLVKIIVFSNSMVHSTLSYYWWISLLFIAVAFVLVLILFIVSPKDASAKEQIQTKQSFKESSLNELVFDVDVYAITYLYFYHYYHN